MGSTAKAIVNKLRQSTLIQDFSIHETPRALHQPYLTAEGIPKEEYFTEPTGVFNTAELLINQLGLTPGVSHGDGAGLHLLLNHFVEDVQRGHDNRVQLITTNVLNNSIRVFNTSKLILAGGSIESPKLIRRSSSLFSTLPQSAQGLVGLGLTDHPTTDEISAFITNIDNVNIPKNTHAKIILYSRGKKNNQGEIVYPFNVEININHEYWHLRENDPFAPETPLEIDGASRLDLKFSFGNCLDNENAILSPPPFGYVPDIKFLNQKWVDYLAQSRFHALAGWHKTNDEIFAVLNEITFKIISQFQFNNQQARPTSENGRESWYNVNGKGFGYGTVHHAAGSLRMPFKSNYISPFNYNSVVDENLCLVGTNNIFVCDMSVMPFSSAANPVRTLASLALRLSAHLA